MVKEPGMWIRFRAWGLGLPGVRVEGFETYSNAVLSTQGFDLLKMTVWVQERGLN